MPSVRSHGTLAMIMVNLAKSWLTMVPLPRSWLIMIHGTLAKIMARSWQDLDKITMVRHVSWCYLCIIYSFRKNSLSSAIFELAIVITLDIIFID